MEKMCRSHEAWSTAWAALVGGGVYSRYEYNARTSPGRRMMLVVDMAVDDTAPGIVVGLGVYTIVKS